MNRKSISRIVLVILLGAMIGSLLGQLVALVLPEGVVKEFFLRSAEFEAGPAPLSVGFLAVTLGFKITLNVIGLIGIGIALYFLRWY